MVRRIKRAQQAIKWEEERKKEMLNGKHNKVFPLRPIVSRSISTNRATNMHSKGNEARMASFFEKASRTRNRPKTASRNDYFFIL